MAYLAVTRSITPTSSTATRFWCSLPLRLLHTPTIHGSKLLLPSPRRPRSPKRRAPPNAYRLGGPRSSDRHLHPHISDLHDLAGGWHPPGFDGQDQVEPGWIQRRDRLGWLRVAWPRRIVGALWALLDRSAIPLAISASTATPVRRPQPMLRRT